MNSDTVLLTEYVCAAAVGMLLFFLSGVFLRIYCKKRRSENIRGRRKVMLIAGEITAALLTLLSAIYLVTTGSLTFTDVIIYETMLAGIVLIAITDSLDRIIPDSVLLAMAGLRLAAGLTELISGSFSMQTFSDSVLGALAGGGVLLIASLLSKGGIGAGDVKAMTVAGMFFGLGNTFSVMLITFFLSAVSGLFMILSKKAGWKDELPMAPFLCCGVFVCDALICISA